MSRGSVRHDRGAVTLAAASMIAVLLLASVAVAGVARLVIDHRRAQGAADLAALAGAQSATGGRAGCESAAQVARENHAALVACEVIGVEVEVTVSVTSSFTGWTWFTANLTARARAGPW